MNSDVIQYSEVDLYQPIAVVGLLLKGNLSFITTPISPLRPCIVDTRDLISHLSAF